MLGFGAVDYWHKPKGWLKKGVLAIDQTLTQVGLGHFRFFAFEAFGINRHILRRKALRDTCQKISDFTDVYSYNSYES